MLSDATIRGLRDDRKPLKRTEATFGWAEAETARILTMKQM
jgi:hypothetical protein